MSYDGQENVAYVDGELVRQGRPDTPPSTATYHDGNFFIGGNADWSSDFRGAVAEVAVWNRAITADEVAMLWEAGPGGEVSNCTDDSEEYHYVYFANPVDARYIKIVVQAWETHISMRAGLVKESSEG